MVECLVLLQNMHAYRRIAELGEAATGQNLKLYSKEHKKHRGWHPTELTNLHQAAGMVVGAASAATVERLKTQEENNQRLKLIMERNTKRWKYLKRKLSHQRRYTSDAKLKAKGYKDKYKEDNPNKAKGCRSRKYVKNKSKSN